MKRSSAIAEKQGVSDAFLCSSITFYRRNYRSLRPSSLKPTSDKGAYLLYTMLKLKLRQRAHNSSTALTHNPTVFLRLLSRDLP